MWHRLQSRARPADDTGVTSDARGFPPARLRRVGAVLLLAGLAGLLPAGAAVGAVAPRAGSASVAGQVRAMQAEVARVGDRLAAQTVAYQADRDRLDVLLQQQYAAERAADALATGADAAQRRLDAAARAAYVNGVPEDVRLALSLDPRALTRSLDTVVSLERVGGTSRGALRLLLQERARTEALAARREGLRRQAQLVQSRSDDALAALQAEAAQAQRDLSRAQARLAALRAAEAERARRVALAAGLTGLAGASGPPCSAPPDGLYANGFLPEAVLCPLETAPGQRLVAPAAAAFDRLSRLRQAQTGTPLCVTDSYRDYAGQVAVFAAKPSLAATPGRSQHGLGLAVDLCGGVQRFDTEVSAWMRANAPGFGFVHPSWAEPSGSRPEPWHWEYVPPVL